jgi:AcrR family transcriptional regulator
MAPTPARARRLARSRRSDGARTHDAILDAAARLASIEGIHGLTLGRLADELGVSKSGLFAHFGSKEQLQRETIEAALGTFGREVMQPAMRAEEGLPRLEALVDAYFSYLERWVFPGGCFFAALLAEADARSGAVHEMLEEIERAWMTQLASLVRDAQRLEHLATREDPEQIAFELYACMEMANYMFVLFRDPAALARGKRATRGILTRSRTDTQPATLRMKRRAR